ncbi:putative chitinase [Ophiocordyceps polyrhachis-furcata BCC 54312]|uniref:chitinase n=1 Tax=Ophiocordyceps polyrhachis-furcata BCC 54312 TaxID=1330021 RepID=A0A367LD14_9HYPO|nr:putative chitinase [Ophiocordyceps polyrhachis-furcata BCC 54312]
MRFSSCFLLAAGLAPEVSAVTVGYYPTWKKQYMTSVDLSMYSHVNIAFGIPRQDGNFTFDGDSYLSQTVSELHGKGVKAILSIGGWSGSNLFSGIAKSSSATDTLINSIVGYIKSYGLDGIDIDWEYPGRLGNTCNVFDAQNDSNNFLALLNKLRQQLDSSFGKRAKLITLAVRAQPFDGPNGPLTDVSAFAKAVDWISLMAYDINGGWGAVTGPNAPFNFEKGKGEQLSFVSAIDSWMQAGWPANQMVVGFAFYGHSMQALQDMTKDAKNQYQPQSKVVPLGDKEDASWFDACAGSSSNSGTWQWKYLREQILSSPTTTRAPWVRQWDPTSQTPWLFNPQTKIFISYDDPQSLEVKIQYAASKGLAGSMVWSMNMDTPDHELLRALKRWTNHSRS